MNAIKYIMPQEFSPARPDRDYNARPNSERIVKPRATNNRSIFRRIRNIALAGVIAAGAVEIVAVGFNEYDKTAQREITLTEMLSNGEIAGIDTAAYRIDMSVDGSNLNIRKSPSNTDEEIDLEKIRSINGLAWDGSSPIVIKNSPYALGKDPGDGVGQSNWLAVELVVGTLLGNQIQTVGFINNSRATERHITTIDKGKIAQASSDSHGHLIGKLNSGRVIPTERIALGIPLTSEPTPQS